MTGLLTWHESRTSGRGVENNSLFIGVKEKEFHLAPFYGGTLVADPIDHGEFWHLE